MMKREFCPACRAANLEKVLEAPYSHPRIRQHIAKTHPDFIWDSVEGQFYTILLCRECGTLCQETVWTPEEADRFYNLRSHADYQERPLKLSSIAHISQEVILLRLLLPGERPRVLDYGMGWANWATMALAFGCQVSGVEINAGARARAEARGILVVEPDQLQDHCYDFINLDQVIEHLVKPIELVAQLATKLRNQGLMLLGVPGHTSALASLRRAAKSNDPVQAMTEKDLDALSPLVHLTLFNDRSLKALAAATGLEFYRPPIGKTLASGTLWNTPRQWNRNLYLPFKFWFGKRTRLWFRRAS